jgi:hypothetical protein
MRKLPCGLMPISVWHLAKAGIKNRIITIFFILNNLKIKQPKIVKYTLAALIS